MAENEQSSNQGSISFDAGVAADGFRPFVIVSVNEEQTAQMTPGECAELGFQAIESAQEAERDSGLMRYFKDHGFSDEQCATILYGLREYRDQHRVEGFDQKGDVSSDG